MIMTIWLEPHRYYQCDVKAYVPHCDDSIHDYVILIHYVTLVIASLGGLTIRGWCTWIMEVEIIMMDSSMEMEIPKEQWAIPSHIYVNIVLYFVYFHMR